MAKRKIAISIEGRLLGRLDALVRGGRFASRSQALEHAAAEMLEQEEAGMLARECAKLDPGYEQKLAEEGLSQDASEWPEY